MRLKSTSMNKSELKCPRDNACLEEGEFHGVRLHKCQKCDGTFLPRKSLPSLLKIMSHEIISTIPIDYPIEKILDHDGDLICPRCDQQMEHYGYMGTKHIMIDCCNTCVNIWTDAEELGGMSLLYARTEKRSEHMKNLAEEHIKNLNQSLDTHFVSQAVSAAFLTGFIM